MPNPSIIQNAINDGSGAVQLNGITTALSSNVTSGSAIIAFYTMADFAGVHTDLAASDTLSNSYTKLDQANTSPTGGAATLACLLAVNSTAGADSVKTFLSTIGDVEDYQANAIVEVGNVLASPLVGHSGNTQNALAPGTNNLVSGNITLTSGQVPCILVGLAYNTSQAGTPPAPTPGTGMTSLASLWKFGTANNSSCIAYQVITTAGTYQAVFNQASSATEDCACVAVALQGTASGLTLALAGQSSTFAAGALAPSSAVPLTGAATTSAAGLLSPGLQAAITGAAATSSAGLLTPSTALALPGQAGTFSAGTVTALVPGDLTLSLTGQAATFLAGTLGVDYGVRRGGQRQKPKQRKEKPLEVITDESLFLEPPTQEKQPRTSQAAPLTPLNLFQNFSKYSEELPTKVVAKQPPKYETDEEAAAMFMSIIMRIS